MTLILIDTNLIFLGLILSDRKILNYIVHPKHRGETIPFLLPFE